MIISKWNDKKLKLGWTIRLNNGKLAKITWIDGKTYTAKVIEPQPCFAEASQGKPTEQELS